MYPYDCVISKVAARSRLLGSWSAWAVSFWLTSLWVTSLGLRLGGFVSAAETRPNILFILTDDTGWTALSCYGNRDVETPHLDRLASQGMRFTNAYADAQCSPTRAAFFSGQYGARSGVFKVIHEVEPPKAFLRPPAANLAMAPALATLAQTLRQAGYATGLSGKWHIADSYQAAALRDRDDGQYFERYGFDFCGGAIEAEHPQDKAVTAITDDILHFIESHANRPWFAYLAHFTTHTKLSAPPRLIEKHAARGYRRTTTPNGKYAERPTAEYLAMLEHLDAEVGRLLRRLDELQLTDRTIVFFTSDNGGLSRMASCAPLREGKGSPYEGGIRVPLLVRWPGAITAGSLCQTPVHTVDFYPTFTALAGATPPAGQRLDGENLLPLLRQSGAWERQALYWHMPTYTTMYGRTPCAVIRQGDWKLIHWFGDYLDPRGYTPDDTPYGKLVLGSRTELYHLGEDPGEQQDRAAAQPEKVAELRQALEVWWEATGASFPEKNPDFDESAWWGNKPVDTAARVRTKAPESRRRRSPP
jgi:arylsulfatase A